jgi:hypothetical protein
MDAVRTAEVVQPAGATAPGAPAGAATKMDLFSNIAVGEAPQ